MSMRLAMASMFIRGGLMTRWLEIVDRQVCVSLAPLVGDDAAAAALTGERMPWSPAEYRRAMAEKHARLVSLVIERRGREAGVHEGRVALHAAGVELGRRLRAQLGLSGEEDLVAAAGLLYRILGIEFEVQRGGEGARLLVRHCSLSECYSPLTCEVISAMDEGVVEGLEPRARMAFTTRNIGGAYKCEAELRWEVRE